MKNTLINIALVVALLIIVIQINFKEFEISTEKYEQIEQWKKIHPELNTSIQNALQDGKILGKEYIEIKSDFERWEKELRKVELRGKEI